MTDLLNHKSLLRMNKNRSIRFKVSVLIACCNLLFLSCKRDTNTIGPSICAVSDDFKVITSLSVNSTSPDFSLASLLFTADFSEVAPWKIRIKGTVSGAVKILQGNGKSISVNWDGGTDTVYFFRNELCETYLEIPCRDPFAGPSFTIQGEKNYSGILVSDFEGNGLVTSWTATSQVTLASSGIDSAVYPPQGKKYFSMKGTDDNNDFGVGLMLHNSVSFGLPANPTNVYLNAYIYGIPNTRVDFRVLELDGDQYSSVQFVTWKGWKLVSIKYADFELSSGTGVNGKNPDLCSRTRFLLKSSPSGNYVESYIDYIVFTIGTPFTP